MEFDDLRRPLYSALAARLLLFLAPEMIPDSNDIEGQAQFWQQYYNTGGSIEEFTGAANGMLQGDATGIECVWLKTDL